MRAWSEYKRGRFFKALTKIMTNNVPQQVTNRYISALINKGKNDTFEIITLQREQALHDGIVVGSYFDVTITKPMPDHASERASGVTAAQAVSRALSKFGVTFRE